MTVNSSSNNDKSTSIVISSMHRLPIIIICIGILLIALPIQLLPGILITSFGCFLLIQSFTLKLKLTSDALIVMQLGKELRRFPFENWIAWRIFFPQLPGLLYFREKVSPHLLPLLFDPVMLEKELKLRVGELEIKSNPEHANSSNN